MNVRYEWVVETLDGEDIVDVNHAETYLEARRLAEGLVCDIGVVRDRYDPGLDGDLACRSWAYIVDGVLPAYFENASGGLTARVPARFHAEIKAVAS